MGGEIKKPNAGHIVAMGGCGFSVETDNTLIDDFVLSLSSRQPARICFIPTASADSANYLVKFYRAFSGRAIPTDLTLFDSPSLPRSPSRTSQLAEFIDDQDIFYVGGGSTANLMAVWRVHGIDKLLRDAWLRGAVLCGVSAGMLCWFQGGITDSFGSVDTLEDGLGLLDELACPHYDSEVERRKIFHHMVQNRKHTGYAADDRAALHFQGTDLIEVVSSHKDAAGYRVSIKTGDAHETRLTARFLG